MTSRTSNTNIELRNKVTLIKSVLQPHWAQESGGRPKVHQKRGHPARFEVHHRKDQAERSEDIPKSGKQQKSVTARSSELRPESRSTPQTTPIPVIG